MLDQNQFHQMVQWQFLVASIILMPKNLLLILTPIRNNMKMYKALLMQN